MIHYLMLETFNGVSSVGITTCTFCTVLCLPTEGEGHIVFAADSIGVSVTLNVCLISREPLADTFSYQIYIDIQHISL